METQLLFLSRIRGAEAGEEHYWRDRIVAQLLYAAEFFRKLVNSAFDRELIRAVDRLVACYAENKSIHKEIALEIENTLGGLSAEIKKYTILFVAHAQIDMNWKWGAAEMVAVVLETFHTMLKLIDDYPEFVFSQSQAAIYQIMERS